MTSSFQKRAQLVGVMSTRGFFRYDSGVFLVCIGERPTLYDVNCDVLRGVLVCNFIEIYQRFGGISIALHVVETWTLVKVDQKYLGSFEMWCWRKMEKISWTDHV
jgi:hypothetical protein